MPRGPPARPGPNRASRSPGRPPVSENYLSAAPASSELQRWVRLPPPRLGHPFTPFSLRPQASQIGVGLGATPASPRQREAPGRLIGGEGRGRPQRAHRVPHSPDRTGRSPLQCGRTRAIDGSWRERFSNWYSFPLAMTFKGQWRGRLVRMHAGATGCLPQFRDGGPPPAPDSIPHLPHGHPFSWDGATGHPSALAPALHRRCPCERVGRIPPGGSGRPRARAGGSSNTPLPRCASEHPMHFGSPITRATTFGLTPRSRPSRERRIGPDPGQAAARDGTPELLGEPTVGRTGPSMVHAETIPAAGEGMCTSIVVQISVGVKPQADKRHGDASPSFNLIPRPLIGVVSPPLPPGR